MIKITITGFLLLWLGFATGQYVLVPDSNFRKALLNKGYASCFDDTHTMLDTNCSALLDSTGLIVSDSNIASIEGVQYFKRLATLDCSNNNISVLPVLPILLTSLFCYGNPLDSFPPLPEHLNTFICGYYPIHAFPTLPASLRVFWCTDGMLDSMPLLPDSLEYLVCDGNQLTLLLPLPGGLRQLNCNTNRLSQLPTLPSSLTWLNCSYNLLTSIPSLPDSLTVFYCGNNPQLHCLPELKRIINLNFESTDITCLPNTGSITFSSPAVSNIPLCGPNGCIELDIEKELIDNLAIIISPNPTTGPLKIIPPANTTNYTIEVTNLLGQTVYKTYPTNNQIDVTGLAPGIYLLKLMANGSWQTVKFVKQ